MAKKFSITVTAQMRHGILWEARALLGSTKALAESLGLPYGPTCALTNFRFAPGERWLQLHGERIELKLSEVLGRSVTLEEIFPSEICTEHFQKLVKRVERTVEVDPERLLMASTPTALLPSADDAIDDAELTSMLDKALKTLTPREEAVIKMRYGLDGASEMTLEEIGQEFCVTRECIRYIEARALRKLRHPSCSRQLKVFIKPLPDFSKYIIPPE